MLRPYNISQNLVATPSRIAHTPPALSRDERSFYTTKAWLYERFSGHPEVNTQIINPWTYDSQWRLEEREVIRDAEAMIRDAGQTVPVPKAKPTPKPLPPETQPLPGFEEPFYDDPTITRRMVARDSFIDVFSGRTISALTRPGAMLESIYDLADDLTDDDWPDMFRAAQDWDKLLKEQGATPWPGFPSQHPRLTATDAQPVVYINWPEKQLHVRSVNPSRDFIPPDDPGTGGEAYRTPSALPVLGVAGAAAIAATIAAEVMLTTGLTVEIILALYGFAGIEPPAGLETFGNVMLVAGGILSISSLLRLLGEGASIVGATKITWMGLLFTLGAGIAIWGFLKTDWVEVWELIDDCVDAGGRRWDCTVEIVGDEIVSWYKDAGKIFITKTIEIVGPVLEKAAKSLTPFLIAGAAGIALVIAAKQKVGL
jgi:hypothetical protein